MTLRYLPTNSPSGPTKRRGVVDQPTVALVQAGDNVHVVLLGQAPRNTRVDGPGTGSATSVTLLAGAVIREHLGQHQQIDLLPAGFLQSAAQTAGNCPLESCRRSWVLDGPSPTALCGRPARMFFASIGWQNSTRPVVQSRCSSIFACVAAEGAWNVPETSDQPSRSAGWSPGYSGSARGVGVLAVVHGQARFVVKHVAPLASDHWIRATTERRGTATSVVLRSTLK